MKAMRFHEYGDAGVLRLEEVPRPEVAEGQVLVRVAATAFNLVDAMIRAGAMREAWPLELPYTPGVDVSGTVVEAGAGVTGWSPGDEVVAYVPLVPAGGSAEYAAVPAEALARAPRRVPLVDAAALPVAGLTAYQALFEHGKLEAGQRVLINGAGGGVGGMAVQLAHAAGAYVVATASPRSAEVVRAQGADEVIDYTRRSLADAVTEPVDMVLNLVAGASDELTALVPDKGTAVSASPMAPPDDEARGVHWVTFPVRVDAGQLTRLVEAVDSGELELDVAARYGLADLAAAHTAAEAGKLRGRAVIVVG